MAGEFVQEDGYAVYRAAALEVSLDLFRGSTVIHIADENAPGVDVFFIFSQALSLLVY